jgi:hypothetical protein
MHFRLGVEGRQGAAVVRRAMVCKITFVFLIARAPAFAMPLKAQQPIKGSRKNNLAFWRLIES